MQDILALILLISIVVASVVAAYVYVSNILANLFSLQDTTFQISFPLKIEKILYEDKNTCFIVRNLNDKEINSQQVTIYIDGNSYAHSSSCTSISPKSICRLCVGYSPSGGEKVKIHYAEGMTSAILPQKNVSLEPDISVSFFSVPSNPTKGNSYTIYISVCNIGSSSGLYLLTLSDSNATITPSSHTGTLSPNSCTVESFNWTPATSGTHTLTALASAQDDSNTSNNYDSRILNVKDVIYLYCSSCSDCNGKIPVALTWAENNDAISVVYLTQDISSSSTCIQISNLDFNGLVTFDLNGHSISGNYWANSVIDLNSVQNFKIANGVVRDPHYWCISMSGCSSIYLLNLVISGAAGAGIYATSSDFLLSGVSLTDNASWYGDLYMVNSSANVDLSEANTSACSGYGMTLNNSSITCINCGNGYFFFYDYSSPSIDCNCGSSCP